MAVTETEMIDQIRALLGSAADLLTAEDLASVLPGAVIPDSEGRLPSDPGWVPTWDAHWAAADAAMLLHVRALGEKTLTRVDSEGASFTWEPAQFAAMAKTLRQQSPLIVGGGLHVIHVPSSGSGWEPTSRGWPWGTP